MELARRLCSDHDQATAAEGDAAADAKPEGEDEDDLIIPEPEEPETMSVNPKMKKPASSELMTRNPQSVVELEKNALKPARHSSLS